MKTHLNNTLLYAILLYFQVPFACTLPSAQQAPTPNSQAAQIQKDYIKLVEAFEVLHQRAFELEAYMDTARHNLSNDASWSEEHTELNRRYQRLEEQLQQTTEQLEILKASLVISKGDSQDHEAQ